MVLISFDDEEQFINVPTGEELDSHNKKLCRENDIDYSFEDITVITNEKYCLLEELNQSNIKPKQQPCKKLQYKSFFNGRQKIDNDKLPSPLLWNKE